MTLENKHVFASPVEIVTGMTITFPAPTGLVTITPGVYQNVYTLSSSINNQCGANAECLACDNGTIGFYLSAGGNITFSNPRTYTLLGHHSGNITGAAAGSVTNGSGRPPSVWISEHQVGNQGHWMPKPVERFAGATAGDGTLAGNVRGPRIYHRKFSFPHESAPNVSQELVSTDPAQWWSCFERWSETSMTAYPDENNVPMRGFTWFVDYYNAVVDNKDRSYGGLEYTDYFDSTWTTAKDGLADLTALYPGAVTENEMLPIHQDSASYLFCMMPERGTVYQADASVPAGRGYYNVDFDCHTAGQPTNGWTFTT